MRLRRPLALLVAVLFILLASIASAQPSTLPLVQPGDLSIVGSFTLPSSDGSGRPNNEGSLLYGGSALGLGADGVSLYYRCHDWHDQLARVTIPAMGGVGTVVQPCTAVPVSLVHPGASTAIGGSLVWNNRLIITGYSTYDASGGQSQSHFWSDLGMTAIQGPARLTAAPRRTSGYMGVIPSEWRVALGGPVLTGQCCLSIIGTTSAGPAVTVFDPDQLGVVTPPISSTELIYYSTGAFPEEWRTLEMGGIAFPQGTRSLLFLGRAGSGAACYGYGTSDKALAGTSHPDGTLYCYDPTGSAKGYHAYPYVHRVWAYDANHLAEVKAGTRLATAVTPYAAWNLPGMEYAPGDARIRSATYDPATRRIYLTTIGGSMTPKVWVWVVANPTPVPCTGDWTESYVLAPAVCDATQQQIQTLSRIFTQTGGDAASCPASPVVTTTTIPCVYVPPPLELSLAVTATCKVTVTAQPPDATGGWGVQFTIDGVNLGTRDTSAPYSRSKSSVADGSVIGGTWTKAGTPNRSIVPQSVECH